LLEAAEKTTAIVDRVHPGAHEAHARFGVEDLDLPCEPRRQAGIVSVEACDVLAARLAESPVEGRDLSEVALVAKDADALVSEPLDDRYRPVGARVVDEEQLEVGEGLVENALNRFADVRLAVAHGQQNRDLRRHAAARRRRRNETIWRGRLRNRETRWRAN